MSEVSVSWQAVQFAFLRFFYGYFRLVGGFESKWDLRPSSPIGFLRILPAVHSTWLENTPAVR